MFALDRRPIDQFEAMVIEDEESGSPELQLDCMEHV
jgi:hypothetical protein